MTTVSMNFKIDADTKNSFNKVAEELGLTSSALLNIFVTRVAREKGIPFDVKVVPKRSNLDLDKESKKEMLHELAIVNGLITDDDREITDLDSYFKDLGV